MGSDRSLFMNNQFSTCPIFFSFTLLNLSASVHFRRSWICALEVDSQLLLESVQADIRECQFLPHTPLLMGCCVVYTSSVLPLNTSVFTSLSLVGFRSFETSMHLLSRTVAGRCGGRGGGSSGGSVDPPDLNR